MLDGKYEYEISRSVQNAEKVLKEIFGCYSFYKQSYNAYKHGYRLWVGTYESKSIETAIFMNKGGHENYVPLDDNSLGIVIYNDCINQDCTRTSNLLKKSSNILFQAHSKNVRRRTFQYFATTH